jgi:hypothetical protein
MREPLLYGFAVVALGLEAWFRKPADNEVQLFVEASVLLQRDIQDKVNTQAALLAARPETRQLLTDGGRTPGFLDRFYKTQGLVSAAILPALGDVPLDSSGPYPARPDGLAVMARCPAHLDAVLEVAAAHLAGGIQQRGNGNAVRSARSARISSCFTCC